MICSNYFFDKLNYHYLSQIIISVLIYLFNNTNDKKASIPCNIGYNSKIIIAGTYKLNLIDLSLTLE